MKYTNILIRLKTYTIKRVLKFSIIIKYEVKKGHQGIMNYFPEDYRFNTNYFKPTIRKDIETIQIIKIFNYNL